MSKEFAKPFYSSAGWLKCRSGYVKERISIDGGICEICKKEQGYIVHHIIPINENNINNPQITLDWSNLRYVCKHCHDRIDGHFIKKSYDDEILPEIFFDDKGNPIPRYRNKI